MTVRFVIELVLLQHIGPFPANTSAYRLKELLKDSGALPQRKNRQIPEAIGVPIPITEEGQRRT